MSHSDNSDLYLELYRSKQDALANRIHSNLAQPIVAAKSFAAAIMGIEGEGVKEARELAGVIFEMVDQAYTVAYDLMREAELDVDSDSLLPMHLAIQKYGELLRLGNRGIKLTAQERCSSLSIDCFVQNILLDCIKTILVYLARQTDVSDIDVDLLKGDSGRNFAITLNIQLDIEAFNKETAFIGLRKQLKVLSGALDVHRLESKTMLFIGIPDDFSVAEVIE